MSCCGVTAPGTATRSWRFTAGISGDGRVLHAAGRRRGAHGRSHRRGAAWRDSASRIRPAELPSFFGAPGIDVGGPRRCSRREQGVWRLSTVRELAGGVDPCLWRCGVAARGVARRHGWRRNWAWTGLASRPLEGVLSAGEFGHGDAGVGGHRGVGYERRSKSAGWRGWSSGVQRCDEEGKGGLRCLRGGGPVWARPCSEPVRRPAGECGL